jgi:spore germination cell wall hydrolase CwlJ-like protein
MTEDEMNRFIESLSLATPEPEFNARNLPSPRAYGSIPADTGMFVGGGGERDVSGDLRGAALSPGFRAGPVSGGAMLAAGRDMPAPAVGYNINAELPGGFNAGYRRTHPMDAPSRYDQHMLSLAREILGSNVSGSVTEQDGRRGFGAGVSRPLGGGGNAFINAQRDPRGGHAVMGGMDMRFSRGGYTDGGDIQSNSMPVYSNGQVNWGDSDSAADFARADAALRAMRSAPAAPEARDAPMPVPRPVPVRAPYSAPRDVPLPPVRPGYLDRPYEPEGPFGALDMSSMQPTPRPSISMGYSDASSPFDVSGPDAPRFGLPDGFTPVGPAPYEPEGPFGALDMSSMQPVAPGGKFANRAAPPTPPAQAEPTTDELLALLSNPTKSVASAAIDQAAPQTRAMPNMTPQQRDLIIRTIAAEASGKSPEEAQAIGHVIMNRIASGRYGKTPEKVLFAPNQFEPWGDPRGSNYPMRHKPGTAKYEKAQAALDAALAKDDITGGATLFWGPKAQAALGRPAPRWGRTGGLDIGETRFHREEGGEVSEGNSMDSYAARALYLARGGYATQGEVDAPQEEEYPDGARPLTIYRGERPDAAAGPMDTRGPTSHARYQAALGQLGRFEDVPPMDPAVMGENWANAVQRLRNRPIDPDEPTMSARTPSARERIGDFIAGDDQFNHASMIRQRLAQLATGEGGQGGMGVGAFDFVPFAGGALNATDISHQIGEGDYLGAGISAGMTALPFAGKLVKPAMDYGRRAVEVAKQYTPGVGAAVGAGAMLAPQDAEAANISKLTKLFPNFALSGKPTTRVGGQIMAKDPILAANPPALSGFKTGLPLSDMSVGYEKVPGYLQPYKPIKFEDLEGGWAAPLLSDLSAGGNVITHIGGRKLASPVLLEAGGDFPRGPAGRGSAPAGWASIEDKAKQYMKMLTDRVPEGDRVYGMHTIMSPTAADSSDMMVEAIMRQLPSHKITKSAAKSFDEEMTGLFPNWPGIKNYDETETFMKRLPFSERSQLAQVMDKSGYLKQGFPDIGQTRFAINEPRLLSSPHLSVGYSVSELNPKAGVLAAPEYSHSNYTGSMAAPQSGGYVGGLPSSVHASDVWKNWWESLAPSARNYKKRPQAQRALLTKFPVEKIDAEMVDRVMKKQEENKRIFGWRKGGLVSDQ